MRIIRVAYNNFSFYAQLLDGEVLCLDRTKGLDKPLPLSEVQVLPLAVPSKIVCLGINYRSHAEEMGREPPKEPLLFLKPPPPSSGMDSPSSSRPCPSGWTTRANWR